ncbi:glycosyltransferase [Crassaminicella indica]|uniref:Glycosyltransferase n=1 Tax=Crassaminicella indica TaxID=2855394 RepID=A0ABX8RCE1_9CLOT|nr:glycosyltransferase [Crassaminicella indica]QXM06678.1 glycosyltransferase [Crassaminicella indica]
MKFSVLMSVYYKENPLYLKKAIDSVINQSEKPNEIVLVKDGKLTDELNTIVNEYIQKYCGLFKIVEFKENKGLGIALKEGVKACKYDIIARMDTDDIAVSNRFEKQLKVLRENEDVDIVGSYIEEFEGDIHNILSIRKVPVNDREIKKYAKRRNPFNHMTVMYRKKAVIDAGNYQPSLWNEDYYLWVRMIMNDSKMYNIPECLVYARTGASMFERRGGMKYVQVDIQLQKKFLDMGFISFNKFLSNIILRTSVRIIPNKLRGWVYKNLLRK